MAGQEKKLEAVLAHPQLAFLAEMRERLPQAEWFLVGGAVRDAVMDRIAESHDFDLVVRNVELEDLTRTLSTLGQVDYVGRDFGVLKFRAEGLEAGVEAVDIAFPRVERAGGSGMRRDFDVRSDPYLPIVDDLARRDFTVNAMAWDFAQKSLVDPFGGMVDLQSGLIRAVGEPAERFREDRSRMLRAVRFACQLGFEIEEATWQALLGLAQTVAGTRREEDAEVRLVPFETAAKEMSKALAADAVRAVALLEESGMLFALVPEFAVMARTPQSGEWHSEGDVWTHTKLSLAAVCAPEFGKFFDGDVPSVEMIYAVLLHDVGKPDTMSERDGHISFYGHDVKGARLARSVADRLRLSSVAGMDIRPERIERLVREHLFPLFVDLEHVRRTTLCRYFLDDTQFGRQLLHLSYADLMGSLPEGETSGDASRLVPLMDRIEELREKGGETGRAMSGDEVMAATGLEAGPEIGRLLEELREAQLSGKVRSQEEAEDFLKGMSGQG